MNQINLNQSKKDDFEKFEKKWQKDIKQFSPEVRKIYDELVNSIKETKRYLSQEQFQNLSSWFQESWDRTANKAKMTKVSRRMSLSSTSATFLIRDPPAQSTDDSTIAIRSSIEMFQKEIKLACDYGFVAPKKSERQTNGSVKSSAGGLSEKSKIAKVDRTSTSNVQATPQEKSNLQATPPGNTDESTQEKPVTSDSSRHRDQDDKKSPNSLRLKTVVDSNDCLQNKECLSIPQLGNLLGLAPNDIKNLRPKLQIDDHDIIKPSLGTRLKTAPLDKTIVHARLAHACLNVLKTGENNGVVHDGTLSISRELRYACLHWASHISRTFMCETLLPALHDFCSNDILRWVKNCKELKELPNAVEALAVTRQYLLRFADSDMRSKTLALVEDWERFVLEVNSANSLRTEIPLVISCPPTQSSLYEKLRNNDPPSDSWHVEVPTISRTYWSPCLREIRSTEAVNSIAFSSRSFDGSLRHRVVSGSDDEVVRVWNAVTGDLEHELKGHESWISSVAFSSDGTRVASASDDKTVRLWDAITGTFLHMFEGHEDTVRSVAFSPDGKRIASASDDQTVRIWDAAEDGKTDPLIVHKEHKSFVLSVAFSPRGDRIASASDDGTVQLWSLRAGDSLLHRLKHDLCVRSVAFHPKDENISVVSGCDDGCVRLWNAKGAQIRELQANSNGVLSVAFSPDGTHIISTSEDATIQLLDAKSLTSLKTFYGHSGPVNSVAYSSDGTRFVSASYDESIRIWDARTSTKPTKILGDESVCSVAFSPDGTQIISSPKGIYVWDVSTTKERKEIFVGLKVHLVVFIDNENVYGAGHKKVYTLDMKSAGAKPQELSTQPEFPLPPSWKTTKPRIIALSPNCKYAVSFLNKCLWWWDIERPQQQYGPVKHEGDIRAVAFSPDSNRLVSASDDGTVKCSVLNNWTSGENLTELKNVHSAPVCSVAFSPDGQSFASASEDKSVQISYVDDTRPCLSFKGHTSAVRSVAYSRCGTRIVTCSDDKTVRVWNASDGTTRNIYTFEHEGPVSSAAFSPDGTCVVSASEVKNIIRFWNVADGRARVC